MLPAHPPASAPARLGAILRAALRACAVVGLLLAVALSALLPAAALAQAATPAQPSPHAIPLPKWFSNSLLDFKDEIPEAAREGKRVMIYFGQDGCPYCLALMRTSFGPGPLADKIRQHFTVIPINLWGDADVTWTDGRRFTEKTFARELKVQFTPTLLFFGLDGRIALRLNGYQPPDKLEPVIDYLVQRRDRDESLADYLAARAASAGAPAVPPRSAAYLMRDPARLARSPGGKPLAVLFEAPGCTACAELHDEAFARPGLRALLPRFDVARLLPGAPMQLTTPGGRRLDQRTWKRDLGIALHPTVVFFDVAGVEVFRFDGYLRPFHVESAFEYVASGAYRSEPQFQRYVQARADRLRAAGQPPDLWR